MHGLRRAAFPLSVPYTQPCQWGSATAPSGSLGRRRTRECQPRHEVQLQGTVSLCPTPALRFAPWRAEAQHLLHGAVDGYAQEIVFANTLISPQLSTCYRNRCSEIMALECLQFILTWYSLFRKSPRVNFYLFTSFTLFLVQALFWASIKGVYFF